MSRPAACRSVRVLLISYTVQRPTSAAILGILAVMLISAAQRDMPAL